MYLVTGDLHLARCAWKSMPEVHSDTYNSWNQIVSYACDSVHKITDVILAGDLLDRPYPGSEELDVLLAGIRTLKRSGVNVLFIQGQHCRVPEGRVRWAEMAKSGAQWIHGKCVTLDGSRVVFGLDNLPPGQLQAALEEMPCKADIFIGHQMCRGSLPEIAGRQSWDFDPEWLPEHVKLCVLGDNHIAWDTTTSRGVPVYYTGSLAMQSVDETPFKSFLVIDPHTLAVERVPLVTRPFKALVVADERGMETVLAQIKELPAEALCLVRYDARLPLVEARCKEANPGVFFTYRILPLELVQEVLTPHEGLTRASLEECLSQVVDATEDPELYDLLLALLKSREPKATLLQQKQAHFKQGAHNEDLVTSAAAEAAAEAQAGQ